MTRKSKKVRLPASDDEVMFAESLLNAVACAPGSMTRAKVEATVRSQNPCGTSGGWRLTKQRAVECGEVTGRKHYVFEC